MKTNSKTVVYRVNGFDSVEIKVNPITMEIQSGKSKLEEHMRQKDLDVKELISDGVLYPYNHESEYDHGMFNLYRVEGGFQLEFVSKAGL